MAEAMNYARHVAGNIRREVEEVLQHQGVDQDAAETVTSLVLTVALSAINKEAWKLYQRRHQHSAVVDLIPRQEDCETEVAVVLQWLSLVLAEEMSASDEPPRGAA